MATREPRLGRVRTPCCARDRPRIGIRIRRLKAAPVPAAHLWNSALPMRPSLN